VRAVWVGAAECLRAFVPPLFRVGVAEYLSCRDLALLEDTPAVTATALDSGHLFWALGSRRALHSGIASQRALRSALGSHHCVFLPLALALHLVALLPTTAASRLQGAASAVSLVEAEARRAAEAEATRQGLGVVAGAHVELAGQPGPNWKRCRRWWSQLKQPWLLRAALLRLEHQGDELTAEGFWSLCVPQQPRHPLIHQRHLPHLHNCPLRRPPPLNRRNPRHPRRRFYFFAREHHEEH